MSKTNKTKKCKMFNIIAFANKYYPNNESYGSTNLESQFVRLKLPPNHTTPGVVSINTIMYKRA